LNFSFKAANLARRNRAVYKSHIGSGEVISVFFATAAEAKRKAPQDYLKAKPESFVALWKDGDKEKNDV
jgi:hypothetical protein